MYKLLGIFGINSNTHYMQWWTQAYLLYMNICFWRKGCARLSLLPSPSACAVFVPVSGLDTHLAGSILTFFFFPHGSWIRLFPLKVMVSVLGDFKSQGKNLRNVFENISSVAAPTSTERGQVTSLKAGISSLLFSPVGPGLEVYTLVRGMYLINYGERDPIIFRDHTQLSTGFNMLAENDDDDCEFP